MTASTTEVRKRFIFTAKIEDEIFRPKGIYYQGRYLILVGDMDKGHTIRRKELIDDVALHLADSEEREADALTHLCLNGVDINSFTEKFTKEAIQIAAGTYKKLKND